MKLCVLLLPPLALLMVACSGSGGDGKAAGIYHPDYGPFDENGDYIEALADAPARKNRFSRRTPKASTPKPVAREPEPRLVQQAAPEPLPRVISSRVIPAPQAPPQPQVVSRTVVVSQPRVTPTRANIQSQPATSAPLTTVSTPTPRPQSTAAPRPVPTPAPKPEAVVMKPKAKAPVRHRVTASDTLYGLSRKYGTTVSTIQKANGLRGTNIITGSTLLIPR